jgi:hypothetical protein
VAARWRLRGGCSGDATVASRGRCEPPSSWALSEYLHPTGQSAAVFAADWPPRGSGERPRRKVRFARLIHRHVHVLGGSAVRAAFGGSLSGPWSPLGVVPHKLAWNPCHPLDVLDQDWKQHFSSSSAQLLRRRPRHGWSGAEEARGTERLVSVGSGYSPGVVVPHRAVGPPKKGMRVGRYRARGRR